MSVEILNIEPAGALDRIIVYWHNIGPGQGTVTITCWGSAWTCYFGAMGDRTIQQFFAAANVSYLVGKLGGTQWLKQTKQHAKYLTRIVNAIKENLTTEGQ